MPPDEKIAELGREYAMALVDEARAIRWSNRACEDLRTRKALRQKAEDRLREAVRMIEERTG